MSGHVVGVGPLKRETKEGGRARRTSTTIYLQVREARNAPVGGGGRRRHGYPCEDCVGGGMFGEGQGMRQQGFSCCLLACWALVEREGEAGGWLGPLSRPP